MDTKETQISFEGILQKFSENFCGPTAETER